VWRLRFLNQHVLERAGADLESTDLKSATLESLDDVIHVFLAGIQHLVAYLLVAVATNEPAHQVIEYCSLYPGPGTDALRMKYTTRPLNELIVVLLVRLAFGFISHEALLAMASLPFLRGRPFLSNGVSVEVGVGNKAAQYRLFDG